MTRIEEFKAIVSEGSDPSEILDALRARFGDDAGIREDRKGMYAYLMGDYGGILCAVML